MKFIYAIAALPLVAACAQSPASIQPVSMGNAFAAIPCEQAQLDLTAERQALAALESKQKGAVVGDAVGVFLIGVPVSSLTGNDRAGAIAASKGKILALEARAASCNCSERGTPPAMHTPAAPAGLIAGLCLDNPIVADEIRHLIVSERTTLVAPPLSSPISLPAGFEVTQ